MNIGEWVTHDGSTRIPVPRGCTATVKFLKDGIRDFFRPIDHAKDNVPAWSSVIAYRIDSFPRTQEPTSERPTPDPVSVDPNAAMLLRDSKGRQNEVEGNSSSQAPADCLAETSLTKALVPPHPLYVMAELDKLQVNWGAKEE